MSVIVEVARTWLGTPYVHQMSVQGAGCDCLGLVRGLWREVVGKEPEIPPAYTRDWSEPEGQERLWEAALRHMIQKPTTHEALGDVLLFRMKAGSVAKHLGVQSEIGATPRFIHAYTGHGVVESPLSAPWARRVVARFAFPMQEDL